ncbi:MAG: hypothetical protein EOR23_07890 [Mesorhizobium sp.]|nr:hypothetical protein [Mesorhizobium sp.]RWJ06109.1 MAG: hypothetical protein EOR23_07890 [Mesorhizobium sp.]
MLKFVLGQPPREWPAGLQKKALGEALRFVSRSSQRAQNEQSKLAESAPKLPRN